MGGQANDMNQTPDVPFFANHPDGGRSMLAVYKMVVDHFTHKVLDWEELDLLSGHRPQRKVWTVRALTLLANDFGLGIKHYEPFNYRRLASEGKDYLYELYDNEEVEWYAEHSNLQALGVYLTTFLATVRPLTQQAELKDIDALLTEGRLVSVTLDGRILNGDLGNAYHAVLVIGREGDEYIVHDPGLPAQANRRIWREQLWEAMGGEENMSEVTGFMLRKAGLRLDQYVVREKPSLSRGYAVALIDGGKVTVNGQPSKPGYKLRDADAINIDYDEANQPEVPDIQLQVLYEDADCIVIDKPAGLLTHNKGVRYVEATVASFVRSRISHMDGERAGIVHRLDRGTSGVIIAAKTPEALSFLQKQFHDRLVTKTYLAVVPGQLEPGEAIIDMPIERNPKAPASFRVGANGKPAQTYYRTMQTGNGYSLLELQPKTGRTHQLRVHLASQGHPIIGDVLYGGETADRLFLHAAKLEINLPDGSRHQFESVAPEEFQNRVR